MPKSTKLPAPWSGYLPLPPFVGDVVLSPSACKEISRASIIGAPLPVEVEDVVTMLEAFPEFVDFPLKNVSEFP